MVDSQDANDDQGLCDIVECGMIPSYFLAVLLSLILGRRCCDTEAVADGAPEGLDSQGYSARLRLKDR